MPYKYEKLGEGQAQIGSPNYVVLANCAAPLWDKKRWHGYPELAHLLGGYHIVVLGSEHDRKHNPPDAFPEDTTFLYDLPAPSSCGYS